MKSMSYMSVVAMLLSVAVSAVGEEAKTPKPLQVGDILTDEQVASLLTKWTDKKTRASWEFTSSFERRSVSAAEKGNVQSGKIPIRITCSLDKSKVGFMGDRVYMRESGTASFYIMDSEGKVVIRQSMPLDKMCPS